MQSKTDLRNMFSYSYIPLIILALIIGILSYILFYKKRNKNSNPVIIIPNYKNLIIIKTNYLNKINILLSDYNQNKISSRHAYQELSNIIRTFIYETTNIKVQNYTLEEIKNINMPILYELVSEYYDPEFAKYSEGNIEISINKTRGVIVRWN